VKLQFDLSASPEEAAVAFTYSVCVSKDYHGRSRAIFVSSLFLARCLLAGACWIDSPHPHIAVSYRYHCGLAFTLTLSC